MALGARLAAASGADAPRRRGASGGQSQRDHPARRELRPLHRRAGREWLAEAAAKVPPMPCLTRARPLRRVVRARGCDRCRASSAPRTSWSAPPTAVCAGGTGSARSRTSCCTPRTFRSCSRREAPRKVDADDRRHAAHGRDRHAPWRGCAPRRGRRARDRRPAPSLRLVSLVTGRPAGLRRHRRHPRRRRRPRRRRARPRRGGASRGDREPRSSSARGDSIEDAVAARSTGIPASSSSSARAVWPSPGGCSSARPPPRCCTNCPFR